MEISIQVFKKLNIELPHDRVHDLAVPLLGIYLKELKSVYQGGMCICMFTAALFTIANTWKQPNVLQQMEG